MLKKEDRIRTEYNTYSGVKQIQYVHKCKECCKEILKTSWEEKNCTGYCDICVIKHKKSTRIPLDENGNKRCNICERFLPTSKFLKKGSKKQGFSAACSKCHNLKKFGINSIEYELIYEQQNGKCAICNSEEKANDKHKIELRALAVDHNHINGKVRGLLCTNCNLALGHLKDNINILEQMILYLKSNAQ